jgi:hypothetical protein
MRNAFMALVSAAALGLFGITTVASAQDTSTKTHAHKHHSLTRTADLPRVSALDAQATANVPQNTNSGCRLIHYDVNGVGPKYTAICGSE